MNNVIGTLRDGRVLRERRDYQEAGVCAECKQYVDPYAPELWENPGDAEAASGKVDMLLAALPSDETAKRIGLEQMLDWDGSCLYCGAPADRVGTPSRPSS